MIRALHVSFNPGDHMSQDNRVVALASAVQLKLSPEATVAAAKVFEAYLYGAAATPAATKPAKPAATNKKPGKSEEEVVKAALEAQREEAEEGNGEEGAEEGAEEASDALPATAEGVQAGIGRLLKANKRKEAIGLLKKFGAASASGVKAKDFSKFIAEVNKLLPSEEASGGDDDLTA